MTAAIVRYPLDKTGLSPNNLVHGELHTLPNRNTRAIATTYGAFFTESLRITDVATQLQLVRGTQFYVAELYEVPTEQYGKEICAIIVITDKNVSANISLQYQALGGEWSTSSVAVVHMLDNLALDNRPVAWSGVIQKPSEYPPSHHLHDVGDVYGFEYMVHALDRIRMAIELGDAASHDQLNTRIDNAIAAGSGALAAHVAASDPHPQYMTQAESDLAYVKQGGVPTQRTDGVYMGQSLADAAKVKISGDMGDHFLDYGNVAFEAWVLAQVAAVVDGAPVNLNTLKELATAVNNDPAFGTNVIASLNSIIATLALKAPLASPDMTGIPKVPTAALATNTTQAASTAFVINEVVSRITSLINGSPAALDTLKELANALGNDANFATTMTTLLATKATLVSGVLPISQGGTAAATATQALTNLGAFPIAGGTLTGPMTTAASVGNISTGSTWKQMIVSAGAADAAYQAFHRPGAYAAYFGLDTDNQFKVGGWSMGNVAYKLFHEGNSQKINRIRTETVEWGSYGSISINGNTNGWGGIAFPDQAVTLMVQNANHGMFINNGSWLWQCDSGGNFTASGDVAAYSDERLKKNWRSVQKDFVTKLANVKHGIFERTDTNLTQVGVSAQSLEAVLQEAVRKGSDGFLTVNYGGAAMVAAVELAKVTVVNTNDITELWEVIADLRARLAAVESKG
jgi:hypothetical protein